MEGSTTSAVTHRAASPDSIENRWAECPLTFKIFDDPVVDPCGHTFERLAIEQWIDEHHNCPTSKKPLEKIQLVANISIRDACNSLHGRNKKPHTENQESLLMQQVFFLSQQMSKLINQANAKDAKNKELEGRVDILMNERREVKEERDRLSSRVDFLMNESREFKEERDRLSGRVNVLTNESREFKEERDRLRNEKDELSGRVSELESQLARPAAQNGQSNVQLGIVQNGSTVVTNPLNSNENGTCVSIETTTLCGHLRAAATIAVRTIFCYED